MSTTTDISIILDRSGSMESIQNATIEGFNSFLAAQQKDTEAATLSLYQFDHEYTTLYEAQPILNAAYLTDKTFVPRGMTALLDAIGTTISSTKKRIKKLPKNERPENLIITIITDGGENASTKYTKSKVLHKITKLEAKHGWKFVFIGANQDAISEARTFGIKEEQALTFAADDEGMVDMMYAVSDQISDLKKNNLSHFCFSEDDREKQRR